MPLWTCSACSTQYAMGLDACPHCGTTDRVEEGSSLKALPRLVNVSCTSCSAGPWNLRLDVVKTGLLEIPNLFCASCGTQVQVPWPPKEEPMSPKITVHGGATNARDADVSPAVDASQPQDVAEDVLGRPTSEDLDTVQETTVPEPDKVEDETESVEDAAPDYDAMTLAELREAAADRKVPSYGTKAQIVERLHEADSSE